MLLLALRDLTIEYKVDEGYLKAVDKVSLDLAEGEVLGLAGESGCGKSTIAMSLLRILPRSARATGTIELNGVNVLNLSATEVRRYRWKEVSLVPQGSMNAFDPVISIGAQIVESIRIHEDTDKPKAWERTRELFSLVGIPQYRVTNYPHEFSGGMRQRAAIAMALSLHPKLVILDEPTTALDVVVQKQILSLLMKLKRELGISFIFITHDLSVLSEIASRIAIMYAGKLVEIGPKEAIFASPKHPYGQALMTAIPTISGDLTLVRSIPGLPPNLLAPPSGCRFHPRCPYAFDRCVTEEPALLRVDDRSKAACHLVSAGGKNGTS